MWRTSKENFEGKWAALCPFFFKSPLDVAMGSLFEMETQMEIALNLGYINEGVFRDVSKSIDEVERMLSSLRVAIKRRR